MENSNPVLVLETENNINYLKIEYIQNDAIPEILNGESGFHVYHVRMLTELIATQMAKQNPNLGLSDEDISAIAVASSLHDVGKMRVPESILNFPGRLSPIEYDIIKKHSVFGEEIIAQATGDIDPLVLKYAKEIARSHHERIDGAGYPDALRGDAVPLCAQIVAIADSFDALTSSRSYKEAFSQDVAIEMLANGMSGVFSSEIINALLKVVNNNVLVAIRQRLHEKRSIVSEHNVVEVKKALLIGNTGYVTKEFIDEALFDCHVTIAGDSNLKSGKKLKVFNMKKISYKRLFNTYEFDVIIIFSSQLRYNSGTESDESELCTILSCIGETRQNAKIIYFSSLDAVFKAKSDKSILTSSKEALCDHYRQKYSLSLKIVRIPYLYSSTHKKDWLYRTFENITLGRTTKISENAMSKCHFISENDLAQLVERFLDNWKDGTGTLTVNDEFGITFSDITDKITEICPGAKFDFTSENDQKEFSANNLALKNEYGWFAKISPVYDMEDQHEKFLTLTGIKDETLWDRIKLWMKNHTMAVKIIELFVLFLITELLLHVTSSSIVFSIVDFRMAYIVIMAITHGLSFGIAAAGLSSLSWLVAKMASGTRWITIFYEPTNWLSFIFFFLVGSVCGYIKIKKDDRIKELDEQNSLLTEKLTFTRELYDDTYTEKKMLKKQIISSKDSFGKIFDITRQLNTVEPRDLYLKLMDTFENILENKSISVYSINENSAFGRLEVASKEIVQSAARSISLDTFEKVMKTIEKNDIWKNVELESGLPMFASGVFRAGKLELLILVWHSTAEQRTLYWVNLFKILCDLVQMSLLRAYDYNNFIRESQYIESTHIMNTEAFEKNFEHFRKMAERKVFSYVRLELDTKDYSYPEIDKMISGKVRANDIIGVDKNGKVNILLSQATEKDLAFVLPRFEDVDVEITAKVGY
ncbi:MAG: HD domain-containing protein [Clostridia bacterium]|nr:HD domain-containing protein [Clostridia bacterium]